MNSNQAMTQSRPSCQMRGLQSPQLLGVLCPTLRLSWELLHLLGQLKAGAGPPKSSCTNSFPGLAASHYHLFRLSFLPGGPWTWQREARESTLGNRGHVSWSGATVIWLSSVTEYCVELCDAGTGEKMRLPSMSPVYVVLQPRESSESPPRAFKMIEFEASRTCFIRTKN